MRIMAVAPVKKKKTQEITQSIRKNGGQKRKSPAGPSLEREVVCFLLNVFTSWEASLLLTVGPYVLCRIRYDMWPGKSGGGCVDH